VQGLQESGYDASMWVQAQDGAGRFMERLSAPYEVIASELSFNPLTSLRRLGELRRKIRVVQPTVIHSHQTRAVLLPLLAARLEGVPIRVYHNHGVPYVGRRGLLRKAMMQLERLNIACATHVVFVSNSTLGEARKDGLVDERAVVPGPGSVAGIDLSLFPEDAFEGPGVESARCRLGVEREAFVVGFVGRPKARKGFLTLLQAWKGSGLSSARGVLLLAGCRAEDIPSEFKELAGSIRALGYHEDMCSFYAACDVVALPSFSEGFPYSLLEASAAKRAVIGSDVPGIRCAIRNDYNGWLFPAGDHVALGRMMGKLQKDRALCGELGRNGRAMVKERFAREQVLGGFLSWFEGVMRSREGVLSVDSARECVGRIG